MFKSINKNDGGTADPLFFYALMYATIGLNIGFEKEKGKKIIIFTKSSHSIKYLFIKKGGSAIPPSKV